MNIIFQNEKQTSLTLLEIFIVKSLGIEILNNGTVTATINDLIFGKIELNQSCSCSNQSKILQ